MVFAEDLFKPGGVFGELTQKDKYMLSLNCHDRDFVVRALRFAKERVLLHALHVRHVVSKVQGPQQYSIPVPPCRCTAYWG